MSVPNNKLLEFLEDLLNNENLTQNPDKMLVEVIKAKTAALDVLDGILFCIKASPEARDLGLKGLRKKFETLKQEF